MLILRPNDSVSRSRLPGLAPALPRRPATARYLNAPPRPLVLVVDEDSASLTILAGTLDARGCDALGAGGVDELFAHPEFLRPDVILVGSVLDGPEVCRRLKTCERWRHVPVLLLTAGADAASRVRGFESGAADVLSRPMHAAELVARIVTHARTGTALRTLEAQNNALRTEIAGCREHEAHLQRSLEQAVASVTGNRMAFCTRAARILLDRFFPHHRTPGCLPPALSAWLSDGAKAACRVELPGSVLEIRRHGQPGDQRYLLTLSEDATTRPVHGAASLRKLGLTPRESEVLFWIARGKSNPETGIILSATANTIKKHMQNIMLKLGVENRLAAAARALEVIGLW